MNRHGADFLSFRRWASILGGLLLIGLGGFYFFSVSAETENQPAQNLLTGKLVFTTEVRTVASVFLMIGTANADGTERIGLTSFPPNASSASWSPDGTKIIYVANGVSIYVMNADGSGKTPLTNTSSAVSPSWSVTGKIAFENSGQIWLMNADGSGQAQFPGITQPASTSPVWSPNGTKLAFVSGGEIWSINADGTNERRLTNNSTVDADPDWSPDGLKIAFTKGASGIGVINAADGTNEMSLTVEIGDRQPTWSPEGAKIAFNRSGGTQPGIYLMDANGSNQVRIIADVTTSLGNRNFDPAWQPVAQTPNTFTLSGRITDSNNVSLSGVTINLSGTINAAAITDAAGNYQISGLPAGGSYTVSPSFPGYYFTPANRSFSNLTSNQTADFAAVGVCRRGNCSRNGKIAFVRDGDIFTMNPDGANLTNITNNPAIDGAPNYSPDGSKIIFNTNRDGNNEIYRMNADGGNPVRLTNNAASDFLPYYSPDGAAIVFVSERDGNQEIYKMNADGANQVRLTNDAAQQSSPAFSPDGRKIIFVTSAAAIGMRLYTMNADGSNQQLISDAAGFYNRPSYSPDGTKIIFVYGSDVTGQTIWTMNADGTNRAQFPVGRSSPTYSPDGTKVTHVCCFFGGGPNPNGIRLANADGSSPQAITNGTFDDFPDWQPLLAPRRTSFDFDGDGRSDISVFRPSDGTWYLLRSTAGFSAQKWGISADVLVPGDYDGDLKTDIGVWRPSDGNFYILNSFSNTLRGENFGLEGDVPTGGDWDGDGKADPAVYRSGGAQSFFYYRGSMGNPQRHITAIPWGTNGDKPVASDYDGDSRMDAAVYRNGTWYIHQSSNGHLAAANFGLATDKLVPADYDADGKTDLAVYRNGVWYVMRSTQGFTAFQFGISSDIPAPGDYDGDGRADPAVYRDNTWYLLQSANGFAGHQFGAAGDKPISSAFVR